jgi:hypothetical protein
MMDRRTIPRDDHVVAPVSSALKGHRLNTATLPPENFPNAQLASRDSSATDISRLVTALVTVNGNKGMRESHWKPRALSVILRKKIRWKPCI